MLQERTVLPIISKVKMIFKKDIIDFAILNEHGFRYTHTNALLEYSIPVINSIERLKEASLPYESKQIDDKYMYVFNDFNERYFAIFLAEPLENETSLSDLHHRLLEASFFDLYLNVYLKHGAREDYALVVTNYEGSVQSANSYANKLFGEDLSHLNDLEKCLKNTLPVDELFALAKKNAVGKMMTVETFSSLNFTLNCFVEVEAQLITFIFTLDAHASFYLNILRGFDFLRVGVAHFEMIQENQEYRDARVLFANMRYAEMMGIQLGDRIGKRIFEIYPDYDISRFNRYKEVALGEPSISFEEYVPQIDKYLQIYSYSPREGEFVNFYYDTSHFYQAKESELHQLSKMRMMSEFAEMGFFEINLKDQLFECDDYVLKLFGQDEMDYDAYRKIFRSMIHDEDKERVYEKNSELLSGKIYEGSAIFKVTLNDETKYLEYYLKNSRKEPNSNKPITILGLVRDVTEEELAKRQIEFYANHDPLTKLYNRHNFNSRIRNKDIKLPVQVALLDLDGLKVVNDILGHYSGDEAIKTFADILKSVYDDAYIARVGGDEFVVLFESGITNPKTREKEVKDALKNVLRFRVPFSVSVGYANVEHYDEFKKALAKAEEEMYRDKLLDRPKRKKRTLRIIYDYLIQREPEIKVRSKFMEIGCIQLMKALGYSREDDVYAMQEIVKYHAIGRIDDYVQGVVYNPIEDFEMYRYLRVETGFKILSTLLPYDRISEAILHQCERFDGQGEPHNLTNDKIPVYSRIIAIVYRYYCLVEGDSREKVHSREAAIKVLKNEAGKLFDPKFLKAFIDILQ